MEKPKLDSGSSKMRLLAKIINNLTDNDDVDVIMSISDAISEIPEHNIEIRIRKAGKVQVYTRHPDFREY